jgi:4-hydroxy-tetrahydrodipicolinate reductase
VTAVSEPTIGVVGLGRLGNAVIGTATRLGLPVVFAASRRAGWPRHGVADVVVDASAPDVAHTVFDYCARHGSALVECVSNLADEHLDELAVLAKAVPVVRATNLALGHHLQRRVVRYLATLPLSAVSEATAAVWERHPATKAHRPSATAFELARVWAKGSGVEVRDVSSRRDGLPVSEHEVAVTWPAETLAVRHVVGSLSAAALGAVTAARWVAGREPELVPMERIYDELLGTDEEREA